MQNRAPKGYFFLTPVWGESYTRLFVETAIPSQLSPRNLPVFKGNPISQYVIFTTPKDAEIIRNAPIFKRLSDTINVTIEYIDETITVPHDLMSACHKRGIAMSDAVDSAALFLNPDLVFADGSFETVLRLGEQGYDVVLVPGIRTLKQGVARALHDEFQAGDILVAPPRALMRIALDNLHSLADSSWWEEAHECDLIPANLYWRAGNEGIVSRCFHLHPLMVYPQRKGALFFGTVDDDYVAAACPNDRYDYVVTNSDELLTIELSDPGRAFLTGFRKESVDDTVVWAEQFTNRRHRSYFDKAVCMQAGRTDTKAWEIATRKAEQVANTVKARMAVSTWNLFITGNSALQRRLIRWSQDYELQKVNRIIIKIPILPIKHTGFSLLVRLKRLAVRINNRLNVHIHTTNAKLQNNVISGSLLNVQLSKPIKLRFIVRETLIAIPFWLFSVYVRLVRQLANKISAIKSHIYGSQWHPYPWIWRYRYINQLYSALSQILASQEGKILVVAYDCRQSAAIHYCDNKANRGLFVYDKNGIRLIDLTSSQVVTDGYYDTLVIERALPHAKHLNFAIIEAARVLKPNGKLILLVNHVSSPAERLEYEFNSTCSNITHLLAPEFKVLSQSKQGAFGQELLHHMLSWTKLMASRVRLPFIIIAPISLMLIPLNIILALAAQICVLILDTIDVSGRCYISSVTVATKASNHHAP